jgi:hypothetical protein
LPKVPGTGVDVANHDLGLGGVRQERQAAGGFDLVGDPVPVPDALQGNGSTFGQAFKEGLDGARLMIDSGLTTELAMLIENGELRIATMGRRNPLYNETWLHLLHLCVVPPRV